MRESVLPTLLTLAGNGNKVLAAAGRDCVPVMLEHVHHESMLRTLASTLRESKQTLVRNLCAAGLLYALRMWPLQAPRHAPRRTRPARRLATRDARGR